MIKKSKAKYLCNGEKASLEQIYSKNRKRRGRSKYLLSVEVALDKDGDSLPARLVFVQNKSNRKDWLALISTDTGLSEEEFSSCFIGHLPKYMQEALSGCQQAG